jgi:hypothetical protein
MKAVILSAAKNLMWAECRFFAALRMTASGIDVFQKNYQRNPVPVPVRALRIYFCV